MLASVDSASVDSVSVPVDEASSAMASQGVPLAVARGHEELARSSSWLTSVTVRLCASVSIREAAWSTWGPWVSEQRGDRSKITGMPGTGSTGMRPPVGRLPLSEAQ